MKLAKRYQRLLSVILALPLSLMFLLGTIKVHVKIYKWIYPHRDTEYGHNYYFDEQLSIHLWVGWPLLYLISVWLIYKVFFTRSKK